jgi:hypothetical protein
VRAGVAAVPAARFGELTHRRHQGRQAHHRVEQQPAQVDRATQRPVAVELRLAVEDVRDQQADHGDADGRQRPGPPAGGGQHAQHHGERQHVAERVTDRDDLLEPGQFVRAGERRDPVDPGHQGQGDRRHQRVEQRGPVGAATGPDPDEDQEGTGEQRIDQQVEQVGDAREGRFPARREDHVVRGVAAGEADQGGRRQIPRQAPRRPVQPDAEQHHGGARITDQRPGVEVLAGKRVVHHGQDHDPGAEQGAGGSRRHAHSDRCPGPAACRFANLIGR